ncbi:MarR family winged helix-turn-helix transcriptional regulator [Micromonospora mirobrigensis]|uniref:DNA-binding transcriptional regulator, MarR family n=1 Tax=Micromonospora mirobrigensis TaxID=262898 RepID=A0A1C4V094_9ACTN|nr:MarR family winged helix-turn-helix transcriptional regulator [Micromonospora mirobrigensis]SCE77382.1 DNA-binding transcriptional regulator, MarR family [Micromonospora mirobrigensis]
MPAAPVDQPEHRSGPLLDHLARRMRIRSESVLTPLGLRPRHLVALTVLRDAGGISQRDLAGTLQLDGTNVVGLLNDLEAAGLVERRRSAEDRRRHVVELTEHGATRLNEAECALAVAEDDVLGALEAGERETLYTLLRRASAGAAGSCAQAVADGADACGEAATDEVDSAGNC